MRIGELASKCGISQSTIRYYIAEGVLVPAKRNSQYVFNSSDILELEIVIELKKLFFSIEEIQEYLQIIRLYNSQDNVEKNHLSSVLEKKYAALKLEIKERKRATKKIEELLTTFNIKGENYQTSVPHPTTGMPLEFAANLSCPECGSGFFLHDVTVQDNKILHGKLKCNCGYQASIDSGIILTPKKGAYYTSDDFYIMHYREIPPKDQDFVFFEYMNDLTTEAVNLMYSSYTHFNNFLSSIDLTGKVIFVPDLASHFLYKFIKSSYFKNNYIIVSGFSKQNILSIKSHIDAIAPEAKIIYIANTIHELPIKKSIIDLWIDSISSYNFGFFHPFSLHEKIYPYMKHDSLIVGLTKYYKNNAKSIVNIKNGYANCIRNHSILSTFELTLRDLNWDLNYREVIGKALDPGPYYEYHQKGEEHHYMIYHAKK